MQLDGHAVGNLLLLALTEELGRFHLAVDELAALVGIRADRARVVPVAEDPVVLVARAGGRRVEGQVAVALSEGVEEVWVEPRATVCDPRASAAVMAADQVVLGPGSLFTSVLAAAVVGDLRRHLADSEARVVYVCNLHAESAETRGYDVTAHLAALAAHGVHPHVVVTQLGALPVGAPGCEVVEADIASRGGRAHDPAKLGSVLAQLV